MKYKSNNIVYSCKYMGGWGINLLWRDIVRPAILVGKYHLYPRIPMPKGRGSMSI